MTSTKTDSETIERTCTCGETFTAGIVVSPFTGNKLPAQSHCDKCLAHKEQLDFAQSHKAKPGEMSNIAGYENFRTDKLPEQTKTLPGLREILNWKPQCKGVILVGSSNLGKSYVTFETARRVEKQGFKVAVVNDAEINRLVRENEDERTSLIKSIRRADVVLWDDFGSLNMSDAVESFLNDILQIIDKDAKPIIGSTNYSGSQIKEHWRSQTGEATWLDARGEKLVRRFRGDCEIHVVK